jgi:hypothetical protein
MKWSETACSRFASFLLNALPAAHQKAGKIVRALSDIDLTTCHGRHLHYEDCQKMGLVVEQLETPGLQDFQDMVLTVHHSYIHALMNTPAYKIIENHTGVALIKNKQA